MNDMRIFKPDNPQHGNVRFLQSPKNAIAPDCKHFKGDRPCMCNQLCRGCKQYQPYTQRICIIKLGALGDVIRTLCILPTLKEQYPNAQITWISKPNGCRMIQNHDLIDRVLTFDPTNNMVLTQEQFDLVINLDKEPEPCALTMTLFAKEKRGIGLSKSGTPIPLNSEAEHYFNLGLSDELKFNRNTKSYPQLIHEALGLQYNRKRYQLPVDQLRRQQFQTLLQYKGWNPNHLTIGINVGAGNTFANKMLPPDSIKKLIVSLAQSNNDIQFILLGGPDERDIIDNIITQLHDSPFESYVFDAGTEHDEPSFVAMVDLCDLLFSGDTMAMHVAIALQKCTILFFGPTCEQEIDLFDKGTKLIANVPCRPCYKSVCDQRDICVKNITTNKIAHSIEQAIITLRLKRQMIIQKPVKKAG